MLGPVSFRFQNTLCHYEHVIGCNYVCVPFQVKAERPNAILGVICGALCISEVAFRKRFADYQALLER